MTSTARSRTGSPSTTTRFAKFTSAMPELPDVETYRRYLGARTLRQRIRRVEVAAPSLLPDISERKLRGALVGRRFRSTRRHGKHLFVRIGDERWLMLHFGMTGSPSYYRHGPPRYTRLLIDFERGGYLADPRKLGRIALASSPREFVRSHRLGPDALALGRAAFRALASRNRGAIKPWLMNQRVIAGIGNIYADEILFQARIHPRRGVDALERRELARLFTSLRGVLQKAIAAHADAARMPQSFLLPRRRRGARCPRCGARIKSMAVGARTAYYCPKCQRAP
jgi:formamidopyrimidine-DNA glycosylase